MGVDGIKTGYLTVEKYSLAASLKKNERRLISVASGFPTKNSRSKESSKLLTYGFNLIPPVRNLDSNFSNKIIVITGSFNSISRRVLKEELIKRGGKVTSSISQKTNLLILGENPGSKLAKAQELKVEILNEEKINQLLNT